MIKKLQITDFESHKDTTFEFGPGFNCIHGKSNHGKSSALRALELAGYGVWAAGENKKKGLHGPVRIGSSACEVYVESDIGYVRTKRGKGVNDWEIKDFRSGDVVCFQNPGSGPIEIAQEILGMETMEVAGNSIRFNWSDQRDKHFLIDEVEGKSSSPSFVAAVLDEVGGLSGCEDLIRSLASDKSKFEQQMKKAGEEAIVVEEELERFAGLDDKLKEAVRAEELFSQITEKTKKAELARSIQEKAETIQVKIKEYINLDSEISKREQAEELVDQVSAKYSVFNKVSGVRDNLTNLATNLSKAEETAAEIEKIDVVSAQNAYNKAKDLQSSSISVRKLYAQLMRKKGALDKIPEITIDFKRIRPIIDQADAKLSELQKIKTFRTSLGLRSKNLLKANEELTFCDESLNSLKIALETLLESAGDICPFCNQEMSAKCKEEILTGV